MGRKKASSNNDFMWDDLNFLLLSAFSIQLAADHSHHDNRASTKQHWSVNLLSWKRYLLKHFGIFCKEYRAQMIQILIIKPLLTRNVS